MLYEVTNNLNEIKIIPADELEEIAQNVRMIISTKKFTAPMDREFGINPSYLDEPISVSQAKLSAEIVRAVKKFEPRARVTNVFYDGQFSDGKLNIRVQFKILTGKNF